MASKTVTLSKTAYTQLDTGADTLMFAINTGEERVKVKAAAGQPTVTADGAPVEKEQGIRRDLATGLFWALDVGNNNLVAGKMEVFE